MAEKQLRYHMLKSQKAVESFKKGYNCAQSVLSVYADELKFDHELTMEISSGFGAGMGRLQETCGAVTGAFMVIGIYNSKKYTKAEKGKEESVRMIQQFNKEFEKIHGSNKCHELLNCDLKKAEGQRYFVSGKLSEKVCEKCVAGAVEILEELKFI